MFTLWPVLAAMLASLGAPLISSNLLSGPSRPFGRLLLLLGVAASVWCILAGVDLMDGWADPLATADPGDLGCAAGSHGGRGGVILLLIRFWPYCLMALGGWCGFNSGVMLFATRGCRSTPS